MHMAFHVKNVFTAGWNRAIQMIELFLYLIYLTLSMVPNTGIKASTPRDETHLQNMTATCFLSSQQIKCGTCFLSLFPISESYKHFL